MIGSQVWQDVVVLLSAHYAIPLSRQLCKDLSGYRMLIHFTQSPAIELR